MPTTTLAEAADCLAYALSTPVLRLAAELHVAEGGEAFAVIYCPANDGVPSLVLGPSPFGWTLVDIQTDQLILQRATLRRLMTDILTPGEKEAVDGALSA